MYRALSLVYRAGAHVTGRGARSLFPALGPCPFPCPAPPLPRKGEDTAAVIKENFKAALAAKNTEDPDM